MTSVNVSTSKGAQATSAVVHRACRSCGAANPTGTAICIDCGARTPPPEDLGVVSYYHPSLIRRAWFRVMRALGRRMRWTSTE